MTSDRRQLMHRNAIVAVALSALTGALLAGTVGLVSELRSTPLAPAHVVSINARSGDQ